MNWGNMSNKQRAEQTFRDIKLRQERRKEGEKQAINLTFEHMGLAKKKRDKIRCRQYRGR